MSAEQLGLFADANAEAAAAAPAAPATPATPAARWNGASFGSPALPADSSAASGSPAGGE